MNLLKDQWLPIIRKDGSSEKIAIHEILDSYQSNPVMELVSPRPDFKNALYQLLIGIVQVSAMPEGEEDWAEYFKTPYSAEEFSQRVLKYESCFEIDSEGAAFMQDFDLNEGVENSISSLLIEAPGENTVKNNQAHFIKNGMIKQVDAYWAAVALYTLQTFAPSGGQGHRTGLRGGGPLTTMILPNEVSTLWEKLWFNIVSKEFLPSLLGDRNRKEMPDIFPWMKPTKISDAKGSEFYSIEVHPFYHFFGMPRRIRLNFCFETGVCDLTGEETAVLVKSYIAKNYGNNYDGAWLHPLNAYGHDPKKPDEFRLSIKGQPGGIGYRHWLGQAIESERVMPAYVVKLSQGNYRKSIIKQRGFNLWTAGFDMDNMKARSWYESIMPLYGLEPKDTVILSEILADFIKQAQEICGSLRSAVKSAWANRPGDLGGDMSFIDSAFWQNTETPFYSILDRLISNLDDTEIRNSLLAEWGMVLKHEVESLFDSNALAQQEDGLNMKRVVKARQGLGKGIGKMIKALNSLKQED